MGRVYTDRDDEEGAGAREGISIIAIDEGLGQGSGGGRCRGGVGSALCSLLGQRDVTDAAAVVVDGGDSLLPAAAAGAALLWSLCRAFRFGWFLRRRAARVLGFRLCCGACSLRPAALLAGDGRRGW